MRRMGLILFAFLALLPNLSAAKGMGPGFWMEGTVSELQSDGEDIRFVLTGRFWIEQYRGDKPSTIEIDSKEGIPVAVYQAEPFFAMTAPDWFGGAISKSGKLLTILQAAVEHDRVVKCELLEPNLDFTKGNKLRVVRAGIIRATDHDLK